MRILVEKKSFLARPRIIIRDGALVIQWAFNKEVKFATSGQGRVKLNEVDLSSNCDIFYSIVPHHPVQHTGEACALKAHAENNKSPVDCMKRLGLSSVSNRVTELSDQLNQMEENITTLAAKLFLS
ncbi:hypothetical protein HNY73_014415 [Argiope bruennichi]|uniref:Uncharacterized protein n=1 Tax=Argiope bruennichi TaxID=94029 RepID=A0A8T0EQC4_ARGBR|nr:hypothetical protein HNY73_014415 [Argiope bruennichi]